MNRYRYINTPLAEVLSINLSEDTDLDREREILAKRMKQVYGDKFLTMEMPSKEYGVFCRRVDFDGVPIRLTALHDLATGNIIRRLDSMGYPEEAIVRIEPVPPSLA